MLLCNIFGSFPDIVIWNWPPYTEARERRKKEAGWPILEGGSFNEQGNFLKRLDLGSPKTSRFLRPPTRILKVSIEASNGFGHILSPISLNTTFLSQGCILRAASGSQEGKQKHIPRTGKGWVASNCLDSVCGSAGCHVFLMTSSNTSEMGLLTHCPSLTKKNTLY